MEELRRYLERELPNAFVKINEDALRATAYDAKARAKHLVPVDTGALQRSIRVERLGRNGRIFFTGIRAGGYVTNPRTRRLVDYAGYVEFGTSNNRPQPFIRPALQWAFNNRLKGHIWEAVAKHTG